MYCRRKTATAIYRRKDFGIAVQEKRNRLQKVSVEEAAPTIAVLIFFCISASDVEPSLFVDLHIPSDRHDPPQLPAMIPATLTENQLKRRRIVGTILSSEQSYIESLQRLESDYKWVHTRRLLL